MVGCLDALRRRRGAEESALHSWSLSHSLSSKDVVRRLNKSSTASKSLSDSGFSNLDDNEFLMIVRIIKAELTHDFEPGGRMDPYAVMEWVAADGQRWIASSTRTDWNAHMTPQWDHTCIGQRYNGGEQCDRVEFHVLEADVIGDPDLCGTARATVDELLGKACLARIHDRQQKDSVVTGPIVELPIHLVGALCLNRCGRYAAKGYSTCCRTCGKTSTAGHGPRCEAAHQAGADIPTDEDSRLATGTITVQALLLRAGKGSLDASGMPCDGFTTVDPGRFEAPVSRIATSGGTAPFFRLRLKEPAGGPPSHNYYIGKDLSHATDEVAFYEEALAVARGDSSCGGLGSLFGFFFEYAGVLTAHEEGHAPDEHPKHLLVMRNLHDGVARLRLLDIKIGQKTSQAGWQGKSRARALRQDIIDGLSNSYSEGYRLEGFDGQPPSCASMDPLLDIGFSDGNSKLKKKALRVMLQRMNGAEMFAHFLDMHHEPTVVEALPEASPALYGLSEFVELVLHEIVGRLISLAIACREAPVPQKWIGSSVALGFDCGRLPPRSQPEAKIRKAVRVNIFDWGRSELNTLEKHLQMPGSDQQDRLQYWRYYMGGIDRLALEATRAYWHRFSNSASWEEVTFKIFDFDSMSENDFLGCATVSVRETPETTVDLKSLQGATVKVGQRGCASLTYSISWRPCPDGSRLRGAWRVRLVSARCLPRRDRSQLKATSDPFCELSAVGREGGEGSVVCFRQTSRIIARTLDAEWDETFELPVAAGSRALRAALNGASSGLGDLHLSSMLPPALDPGAVVADWARFAARRKHKTKPLSHRWKRRLDAATAARGKPRTPREGAAGRGEGLAAQLAEDSQSSESDDSQPSQPAGGGAAADDAGEGAEEVTVREEEEAHGPRAPGSGCCLCGQRRP